MNTKVQLGIIGFLLSFTLWADGYSPSFTSQDQPWSISASLGQGNYQHMYQNDGQTAVGRVAVSNELLLTGEYAWGLELGLQSGNNMRLEIPDETLALLQWIPVHTTLGPMLDLLITAKSDPLGNSAFFAQLKGGVVYRHWKIQQSRIKELSRIAGEIQAGFGYPITALANLNLLYQGVYGGDPNVEWNNQVIQVSNIPILHAFLVGLSVNL